jgi:Uma2 family endonuclease
MEGRQENAVAELDHDNLGLGRWHCARPGGAPQAGVALEPAAGSAHLCSMSTALRMPPRMTVAEFLEWEPEDSTGALWQLRDGEPEMMAPASDRHGAIQARLAQLLGVHLEAQGERCRLVIAPGVVPSERSEDNCLVPDLGITCAPATGEHLLREPLVLIEILSPTNVSKTRANVQAYRTIPTAAEIVVLHSTTIVAEVTRRTADGTWPAQPEVSDAGGELRLDSIGFVAPLRDAYRTSGLSMTRAGSAEADGVKKEEGTDYTEGGLQDAALDAIGQ